MSSLIKADFKKFSKGKSLLVCSIIALAIGIGMTFLYHAVYDMMQSYLGGIDIDELFVITGTSDLSTALSDFPTDAWSTVQSLLGDTTVILLLCIVITLFITTEYSAGTYKNSIARGYSRTAIYFSKLIVSLVAMAILTILYVVPSVFISNALYGSWGNADIGTVITTILIDILGLISVTVFLTMLAFVIKTSGGAIALTLVLIALVPSVLEIVDIINKDLNLSQYWLPSTLSLTSNFISGNTIWIPITISLCYLVVSLIIGLFVFNKKDIK